MPIVDSGQNGAIVTSADRSDESLVGAGHSRDWLGRALEKRKVDDRVERWHLDALSHGMRRATTTTTPQAPPLELLTLREVCALLRVEPRYVYRLVNERRIPHLKLGHYLRFDATEIDGWLSASRRPVAPHASAVRLPANDEARRSTP